ncbi:MAG TPA: PadR family transcriptional regulator [Rectinemataceae bacterium]|nr:PadR family transcriptional regulator [Rectinemataceae bacterium]
MSIKYAILGFLSWRPFTGYELKKQFADSLSFHWSGNNNQIYGALIQLHKEGAVTIEVQPQEKYPTRKVYAITELGRQWLRGWLLGEAELPEERNLVHIQLAWAEALDGGELAALLGRYERVLEDQIIMCRERLRRGAPEPARSPRESLIWRRIDENRVSSYEAELAWARSLASEVAGLGAGHGGVREVAG